jgi:hypothetical protein
LWYIQNLNYWSSKKSNFHMRFYEDFVEKKYFGG